jgi:hypothetical protein
LPPQCCKKHTEGKYKGVQKPIQSSLGIVQIFQKENQ